MEKEELDKEKVAEHLKKLEEKLNYYKKVVIDSSDAVIIQDFKGIVKAWNKSAERIYGYKEKEMLGKSILKIISPEQRKEAEKNIRAIKEGKPTFKIRQKRRTKDGKDVFVTITYSPIYESGEIIEIGTTEEDISELKKSLADIKESELKYHTLVENVADFIYQIDENYRVISVNHSASNALKKSSENILGKTIFQLFPKYLANGYKNSIDYVFSTKKSFTTNNSRMEANGKLIWLSVTLSPIFDSKGNVSSVIGVSHDITSEKKNEEKLKVLLEDLKKAKEDVEIQIKERVRELDQQKTFFNSIVENIPNMIFVKDAKTLKFQLFNKAGEELLSTKREKMIGKSDYDFFPKKEADFFTNKDREVLNNKKFLDIPEEPIDTKKGQRFLHTKKISILDKSGNPRYLLGISEDITERKKIELELKESKDKFESLFDQAFDAIFVADYKTHQLVDCNKSAEKLMGYSKKKILSMKVDELHPKDRLEETIKGFDEQARGKNPIMISEILTKDEKRIPVSISAVKVLINNREYLQGIFRDISEQMQFQKKIIGQTLLTQRYLDISEAIIVELDRNANIKILNKSGYSKLGYKNYSLVGKNWIDTCIPKEQRDKVRQVFNSLIEGKTKNTTYYENKILTKQGKLLDISWHNVFSRDKAGKIVGLISSGIDISMIKIAEKELQNAYRKLQGLDVMKTEFLSTTSHELKTPLTPMKAQLERLLSRELSKEEQQKSVEIILRNEIRLEKLINEILEISRIESNKLVLSKELVDIKEVAKETALTMEAVAREKGIRIDFKLIDLNHKIYLDKYRIGEVFINLIDNAIKHSGGNEITISANSHGEDALVCVKDNGKGISKEERSHLFERFYQGSEAKGVRVGAGLGLSICKAIVEAHGGKIWARTENGKGTTFCFTIPLKSKEIKTSNPSEESKKEEK